MKTLFVRPLQNAVSGQRAGYLSRTGGLAYALMMVLLVFVLGLAYLVVNACAGLVRIGRAIPALLLRRPALPAAKNGPEPGQG
ncbi:hypothetical protein [Pelagibacterium montanilacus]|uniref:hypothetical protein n=1 Tax=Pelagibacterium montanilacus TaxID=2185280 RepID=UPI000F8F2663|nr:hypothetical protein [Pelagibacterium montanilacus]